jgi:hypothetical protein
MQRFGFCARRLLPLAASAALVVIAGCGGESGSAASATSDASSPGSPISNLPASNSPSTPDALSPEAVATDTTGIEATPATATALSYAYSGTAITVPGIIQAENFDGGGQNVAYRDTTSGNSGGQYRTGDSVDIVKTSGGYAVNNIRTGEWMAYTVNVPATGAYNFDINVASTVSNAAFHVEVDGQSVTGKIGVPNTGSLSTYKWWGLTRINLSAGKRQIKVVADQETFDLDALRFTTAATARPYLGAAIPLPGTFEAENYDNGGEGVAFHELSAGNSGGAYRPSEAVDIVGSGNASGGFAITNFQSGEWVSYTVNVATTGNYTMQIHEATTASNAAFRVEIDGRNVTGSLDMPNTGSTSTYRWTAMQAVSLAAGTHQVKIVSEQEFFNLDSIIFAPAATPQATSSAKLLFHTSLEGAISMQPVAAADCWGVGCWKRMTGTDSVTGFPLPSTLGGGTSMFLLDSDPIVVTPATVESYLYSSYETVAGHTGATTKAVRQQISRNLNGTEPMGAQGLQNEFMFLPKDAMTDLYVSYWLKLQPDMVEKMNNLPAGPGIDRGGTWRGIFALKTGTKTANGAAQNNGDYRIEAYVNTYGGGAPYWCLLGDNNAGSGAAPVTYWKIENRNVPVPVGQWFKLEIYWHRSAGSDGRVWMGANGKTIADYRGPNMGASNLPINRIMAPMLYSGQRMPAYQWFDDLEIWDGFPPAGSNPPYAAH